MNFLDCSRSQSHCLTSDRIPKAVAVGSLEAAIRYWQSMSAVVGRLVSKKRERKSAQKRRSLIGESRPEQ